MIEINNLSEIIDKEHKDNDLYEIIKELALKVEKYESIINDLAYRVNELEQKLYEYE